MKRILFFVLMVLVLAVSSCNLFLKEEYGELILSFDGTLPDGSRALDSNGLPVLSSSPMKIDIIREDGYTVTRELSAEEPKSLVELVPVGERIEIKVTAINPSGQWSGRAFHTVRSGQNQVTVLLNKNVSGLNNLLFTQTKTASPLGDNYSLSLSMGGKSIERTRSTEPYSFARDSKGRLYIGYKDTAYKLARYTSEGNPDDSSASGIEFLVNDYTTGKMYGVKKNGGYGDVYKIDEDLSTSPASITNLDFYQGVAAIDNNLVAWTWKDASLEIKVATLSGSSPSGTGPIHNHIDITGCKESTVNDVFIRGDYVYVLFSVYNDKQTGNDSNLYSLGGVVRYNINDLSDIPPVKIGFLNTVNFENNVVKGHDYTKNFYGAVKVIGFDEENIYIADDGFDAGDTPAGTRIVKNRNRIAALNIETNAVSFTDAGSAKWYNEWTEWRTPNTKTVVWTHLDPDHPDRGMKYYQVENGGDALSGTPFITSSSSLKYGDVFCYDATGNFYIAGKDGFNSKLYRYTLKDGCYVYGGEQGIGGASPKAMAVSVSSIADDAGKTILFYYEHGSGEPHHILRYAWFTDDFTSCQSAGAITLYGLDENDDTVTAMAVNKDGIFAAVKTVTGKDTPNEKYKITVKKYAHKSLSSIESVTASGSVMVQKETKTGWIDQNPPSTPNGANKYTAEELNALYIADGADGTDSVLYGATTKRIGVRTTQVPDKSVITGALLKIGNTDSFPAPTAGGKASVIYSSGELASVDDYNASSISGSFAPYRFIAVKPKKLVIASDGYYAPDNNQDNMVQKNKVYIYDLSKPRMEPDIDTRAEFSKIMTSSFYW